MPLKMFTRKKKQSALPRSGSAFKPAAKTVLVPDALEQALQLGRFGIIVGQRERWNKHKNFERILEKASARIDEHFAMVPDGCISIPATIADQPGCEEVDVETAAFLMARCAVTNAEFQLFVDSGGYQDLELWAEDIWPHLIDLTDLTGTNAPRFWQDGCHDQHHSRHPVVGICFYEALAYARWAGMRLPTEAEWQMGASWRLRSAAVSGRRYPWGDALDTQRCNIWMSGHSTMLPADDLESGAAPNGILQLIGNVWEWTNSEYESTDTRGRTVVGDMLMMSIRGGAYDTYFPSQATSQFRTGLGCLHRPHNTGFRCAIDLPIVETTPDDCA